MNKDYAKRCRQSSFTDIEQTACVMYVVVQLPVCVVHNAKLSRGKQTCQLSTVCSLSQGQPFMMIVIVNCQRHRLNQRVDWVRSIK